MKSFVVIGMGRFGSNLAITLHELGNEVLAIDENENRIQHVSDYVTHAVAGDPKDEAVLKAVGVRNFDCAVVALSDDTQTSILVTLMLKEMGVKYVVSKATSETHMRVLKKVGADKVVYPEKDMGMKLAQGLSMSNILDFIELSDDYSIIEIKVPEKWIGKTLKELDIRAEYNINIIAVKSESGSINVTLSSDYVFEHKDILVIVGRNEKLEKFTK